MDVEALPNEAWADVDVDALPDVYRAGCLRRKRHVGVRRWVSHHLWW